MGVHRGFAKLKTYGWHPDGAGEVKLLEQLGEDPAVILKRFDPVLKSALEAEFSKRGLVPAPAGTKPDFYVHFYILMMLVGVATRRYARSLEPLAADVKSRGTSKSAVSRRFVAKTRAQLETWQAAPLDDLDLVGLLLDGVHVGEHCLIIALGIGADGGKHALGLWEGSTENAAVCQSLLSHLQSRGLRTDRSLLVLLDGSKALRKAVRETFGEVALVQRCQGHKLRNVLDHLPDRHRPWVKAILHRAYRSLEGATAKRLLQDLARRLEREHPSAAESVREGLEETLTILAPDCPQFGRQSFVRRDNRS